MKRKPTTRETGRALASRSRNKNKGHPAAATEKLIEESIQEVRNHKQGEKA